ncbi:Uncharacterised protein [Mycobacteroides abscessus subsp. abscessus]|nr:Uncharacterised protein [Mycobacteroides abscessus subsp. abscessus]
MPLWRPLPLDHQVCLGELVTVADDRANEAPIVIGSVIGVEVPTADHVSLLAVNEAPLWPVAVLRVRTGQ